MRAFKFFDEYKAEPVADGRYHVRKIGGYKLPGLVIGGGRCWFVEIGGQQQRQRYGSAREACKALASNHAREAIDAETRRHEWRPADYEWQPLSPAVKR